MNKSLVDDRHLQWRVVSRLLQICTNVWMGTYTLILERPVISSPMKLCHRFIISVNITFETISKRLSTIHPFSTHQPFISKYESTVIFIHQKQNSHAHRPQNFMIPSSLRDVHTITNHPESISPLSPNPLSRLLSCRTSCRLQHANQRREHRHRRQRHGRNLRPRKRRTANRTRRTHHRRRHDRNGAIRHRRSRHDITIPDLDRQRTRDQFLRTHEQRARQRARDRRRRRAALVVRGGGAAVPAHVRGTGRARVRGTAPGGAGDGRGEDLAAVAAGGGRGAGS